MGGDRCRRQQKNERWKRNEREKKTKKSEKCDETAVRKTVRVKLWGKKALKGFAVRGKGRSWS